MAVPLIAVVTTLREFRSAIVVDVSATGARLQGANLPKSTEELFLTVDGVVVFGTVAWERDDERGVAFNAPLKDIDESRLRKKVAQAQRLPPELKAAFDD
jgi:PilZ domain